MLKHFPVRAMALASFALLIATGCQTSHEPAPNPPAYDRVIEAEGTVEPMQTADVAADVTGKIVSFGTDTRGAAIDFRSDVDQGTILARIDDSIYQAKFAEATAQLASAQAAAQRAQADVAVAEARLRQARLELDDCVIRSPIAGTVLDRRGDVGESVGPTTYGPDFPYLFVIGDLRYLHVWANVKEADVALVQPGAAVTFTVDAYPGRKFAGIVKNVRLNAVDTDKGIFYTADIDVNKTDGFLFPYLIAHVRIQGVKPPPAEK
jgi:HlyD family secretion protein